MIDKIDSTSSGQMDWELPPYIVIVNQADAYFEYKNYSKAKKKYIEANELCPYKAHPKERLQKIDELTQPQPE